MQIAIFPQPNAVTCTTQIPTDSPIPHKMSTRVLSVQHLHLPSSLAKSDSLSSDLSLTLVYLGNKIRMTCLRVCTNKHEKKKKCENGRNLNIVAFFTVHSRQFEGNSGPTAVNAKPCGTDASGRKEMVSFLSTKADESRAKLRLSQICPVQNFAL